MTTSKTHLDEIVLYPEFVLNELYKNNSFVSLLIDVPNANLDSEEVENAFDQHTFDYTYVDGTIKEAQSFCCVDTTIDMDSDTIKNVYITILIGVSHGKMKLKGTGFNLKGNRRDNLIRELDYTLRSKPLGIGKMVVDGGIEPVTIAGSEFSCKVITYKVSNFGKAAVINR